MGEMQKRKTILSDADKNLKEHHRSRIIKTIIRPLLYSSLSAEGQNSKRRNHETTHASQ